MSKPSRSFRSTLWVYSTYFTEGLPYMITRFLSSVYFTDMGVKETYLGFLNFLGIPWNLKFLWAPFVDLFSTKRRWLIGLQLAIALLVLVIAILAGINQAHMPPFWQRATQPESIPYFWSGLIAFLFIALAFLASTNDIAIDAYYMEGFKTLDEQAAYTGDRSLAYRFAVIYARSVLVGIAGAAGWFFGFGVAAVTMMAFWLLHFLLLPRFEENKIRSGNATLMWKKISDSFGAYLKHDRIVVVLLFIATYKLGDEILFSMNTPFLKRELGVSNLQLSWLAGFIGSFSTIGGTMFGAWWIRKTGLKKAIWPLTLLMNINILAYLILSEGGLNASTTLGVSVIAFVHGYENFAGGMGSAALTVYLMQLCSQEFKAAHFAIGTALMSLGSTFIGGFGGTIVEKVGYTNLFLLGFAATLPSMLLLFWLPLKEKSR